MHFSKTQKLILSSSLSVFLAGCGAPNYSPSEMHMTVEEVRADAPKNPSSIPSLVKATPTVPQLGNEKGADTFDVVVTNVPLRDLLFALARDAGVNMDVDPQVGGLVTMSALDQTLDAILERIAEQSAIRIDRVGGAIIVKNDEPYYKRYHIDYTAVERTFGSDITSGGLGAGTSTVGNTAENTFWGDFEESIAAILDIAVEREGDAGAIAGEEGESELLEDAVESTARFSTENQFDFNEASGILLVYAPDRLQREVQAYIDETISILRRQVLLEATVVEVVLSNEYRQGIDWSAFNNLAKEGLALYQGGNVGGAAALLNTLVEEFELERSVFIPTDPGVDADGDGRYDGPNDIPPVNPGLNEGNIVNHASYNNIIAATNNEGKVTERSVDVEEVTNADGSIAGYRVNTEYTVQRENEEANARRGTGLVPATSSVPGAAFTAAYRGSDVSAAVELLDQFGDAKVLSSPRISVLHNQPAILRVVDQEVYFSFEIDESINEETGDVTERTFTVEENTVDVGFSMNVLPHITSENEIFLNLKPSVTRVLEYRRAPVPTSVGAASGGVQNFVPVTRIRELESVMSLRDGEIAVMGGLLEDRIGDDNTSVPGLSKLPGVGTLFQKKREQTYKTEFVVFIKGRVITNPSLHGDYADYQDLLPDSDFIIRDREDTILPPKQENPR